MEKIKINEIDVIIEAIGEYCQEHAYYSGDLEKIKILNNASKKFEALKRLRDNGLRFKGWSWDDLQGVYYLDKIVFILDNYPDSYKDLDLLFGGEE